MVAVSIVVPTYNRSKLLKECVDSLLAQACSDLEIIIVDDGSTDDTQETIKTVTDKQDRVKYYPRPHLGLCAARNFGLDQSSGEFIGFFDSDDLWPPDYVETMVKTLRARPDYGAAYSRSMLFSNGEIRGQYVAWVKPPSGHVTADLFSGRPFILPSSVIFRRDIWNGLCWDEAITKSSEDLDVFLRISMQTKFIYMPDTYAIHRRHNNSISTMAARDLFNDGPKVMERFYFQLGGSSYVPKKLACRNLSHQYRRFALRNCRAGNRSASLVLLRRALYYNPLDLRLYVDLFRAFLLNPKNDTMPDWQLPAALPPIKSIDVCRRCSSSDEQNNDRALSKI
jgi:glycosyltransferase involved in cell wall biosynthesis